MRLAILDDYQNVALSLANWKSLAGVEVVTFRDHMEGERLIEQLSDFDAVCRVRERTHFPRAVLERLPRLKLLLATGRRNQASIDLEAAEELGVTVCSTSSNPRYPVELTWGLILNLARCITSEADSVRQGNWQQTLGRGLQGGTLGVVGLGTIGTAVARVGQAIGMNVVAWSRNLTDDRASAAGARSVSKEELFATSDVVTLHVPLTAESIGLVGRADLAMMKSSAHLINTSRGEIVNEADLIDAIERGTIAGAGIDVFETEPLPAGHPFRTLQNVLATPHIGYVTQQNLSVYFQETVENVQSFLAGRPTRVLGRNNGGI